jgi:Zn-finger nucleic acid-binding protein
MNAPKAGMLCPVCRVDLVMADRQGIEIDYCPRCRGIWLDRGELDKLIERGASAMASTPVHREPPRNYEPDPRSAPPGAWQDDRRSSGRRHDDDDDDDDDRRRGRRRRGGFLADLFDFD